MRRVLQHLVRHSILRDDVLSRYDLNNDRVVVMLLYLVFLNIQVLFALFFLDFDKFFVKLELPDVFYSYCLINFLHVWMVSVPLAQYGRTGLFVRKRLHEHMWKDIETKAKKLNASMSTDVKVKTYSHLNDVFKIFLFGFDEGILSIN